MTRLWVRLMKKHRIDRQTTRECTFDGAREALDEACGEMNVPRPIWQKRTGICLVPHDRFYEGSFCRGNRSERIR